MYRAIFLTKEPPGIRSQLQLGPANWGRAAGGASVCSRPSSCHKSPGFSLKGSTTEDIDMGIGIGVDMGADSDMAVSVDWGSFLWLLLR